MTLSNAAYTLDTDPQPRPIAHFCASHNNPDLKPLPPNWTALADALGQHIEIAEKTACGGFIFADFKTPYRKRENVTAYYGLVLDIEPQQHNGEWQLPPQPEDVGDRLEGCDLEGVIYTSHSHMVEPHLCKPKDPSQTVQGARYRVVVPLNRPITTDIEQTLKQHTLALAEKLALLDCLDKGSYDVSRFFYMPAHRPTYPKYAAKTVGQAWDIDQVLPPLADLEALLPNKAKTAAKAQGNLVGLVDLRTENYSTPLSTAGGFDAVKQAAQGRWSAILPSLGITLPPNAKHAPCPACGGTDRFRFDDQDGHGTFICSQGTGDTLAGDGFALIKHAHHCDDAAALKKVRDFIMPTFGQPPQIAAQQQGKPAANSDWDNPKPINTDLPPVKTLQAGMLPRDLEAYIFDQADRVPMPPDMVAVSVLTALCSLLGARVAIKPKKYDDFAIVPNLWGAFIAPPSSKKSGAFNAGIKPLDKLVLAAKDRFNEELAAFEKAQAQAKVLDSSENKARKALIDKLVKTEGREAGAKKLEELEEADKEAEAPYPVLKRYKTNDSSPEALAVLEQGNPTGILVCRDELTGLLANLDREGNGETRAFYLEGWNGDSPYEIDRIMRGHGFIENHCLSILGGIQPDKLIAYLEPSIKGLGNDGLIQRFQLMVYPDPIQWHFVDRTPNKLARDVVYTMFEQMDKLTHWELESMGARPADTFNRRPYFRFSEPAYQYYQQWAVQLETVKIANEEHTIICEHLSKYNKLMPALALLFHVIDGLETGHVGDVSLRAAEMAAEWCEYLESHARRVYSLVIQNSQRAAATLAEKFMQMGKNSTDKTDKTPTDTDWVVNGFTARQVIRRNWKGLTNPEAVQNALEILVEDHWLWMEEKPATVYGGRPTQRYWINPKIFS